jgi:hypothetical protein
MLNLAFSGYWHLARLTEIGITVNRQRQTFAEGFDCSLESLDFECVAEDPRSSSSDVASRSSRRYVEASLD